MEIYEICPICQYTKSEKENHYCTCISTGRLNRGSLVRADKKLIDIALKCLNKGLRVSHCTIAEIGNNCAAIIRVHFREDYGRARNIFTEMPPDWGLEVEGPPDGSPISHLLLCDCVSNLGITEELKSEVDLTISNLELLLDTLDNEGTRAVLTLAGYLVGK